MSQKCVSELTWAWRINRSLKNTRVGVLWKFGAGDSSRQKERNEDAGRREIRDFMI
jgi:hypothetical protein